jgi:hypothetical protein
MSVSECHIGGGELLTYKMVVGKCAKVATGT